MQRRRRMYTATAVIAVTVVFTGTPAAEAWDGTTTTTPVSLIDAASPAVSEGTTHAENPSVPEGAVWSEHYLPATVPTRDGGAVELHADVLRPAGLSADARTPVILISGPYLSHAGVQSDEHKAYTGPTMRHRAFIDGAGLMAAGYTVVFADLRGFGGSSGCYDLAGPGEQADVRTFVEWAASAPWSNGRVGMYGKSYDAATGLMGIASRPAGLAAVVAQEPAWNLYDYLYENGIPSENNRVTINAFNRIAALPGIDHSGTVDGVVVPPDTERYRANAAYEQTHPECASGILADTLSTQRTSPFWSARDLAAQAHGSTVPLLLTQGWTENNTRPDGMAEFLDAIDAPVSAWAGPWNHVAGNDVDDQGNLEMGRADWFGEVRAFFDAHLRDASAPAPSWALQDNLGRWRLQSTWPGATREVTASLSPGTYIDTGAGANALPPGDQGDGTLFGTAPRDAQSIGASQTLSTPVTEATRLSGTIEVALRARGSGVTHVRVWDVGTDGVPTLFDEAAAPVSATGETSLHLRDVDWTLQTGHAVLVSVGTTDSTAWRPTPSGQTITIDGGTIALPVQSTAGDVATEGQPAPFLTTYLANARWPVAIGAISPSFSLSAPAPTPAPTTAAPARLAESGVDIEPTVALWALGAVAAGIAVGTRRRRWARRR
ncbi:CocE/NonD family hydrolase [Microbacterium trichothecenolyticum]|uniref:Acyl esterase n=1 Tax=Microbacterium trichothecenolyticum TaxID=69370 RepID=A0ABU0TUR5_MICTR|nr:CocE/NonD family hydrolase [Microbacterium trichothecenolyticum]MDQ1123401.1 putative acyl esterase [Microbacterium trichothecenolyticum]